ncbi:hypothetical protein [Demequina salsinemoris]|uniref:hypothetical protein n=1 Tax=Demequina salsinemoris TaxID=577470 RepID=UPI0007808FE6|nr:hypothetical protein [Demequina salsinemoris]
MDVTFRPWRPLPLVALVAAALAGCGPGDGISAEDYTIDGVVQLDVTFDGADCVYDGPAELPAGPAHLTFHNDGDAYGATNLVGLDEGYTIQDVIDDIGPEPGRSHHPEWTFEKGTYYPTAPGAVYEWDGKLEPGLYAIACTYSEPLQVWFGAGLTVTD